MLGREALIVFAHLYCVRKFTSHVMYERARQQMIGQIAIARVLPEFNDLGRSVTPIFLSMDHFPFVNGRCHFRDTWIFFFTINEFFSAKLKKKEN